jgi:hypothetical protein
MISKKATAVFILINSFIVLGDSALGERDAHNLDSGLDKPIYSSLPTNSDLGVEEEVSVVVDAETQEEVLESSSSDILSEQSFPESSSQSSLVHSEAKVTATPNSTISQELDLGEIEAQTKKRYVQISARYLGLLSQAGLDVGIWNQISLGLYYGRYQGTIAGNDKPGIIPDLHHLNLQTTIFLNSQKQTFKSGAQLRFGVHANQQKDSELVERIEVDGREVIRPGQTRYGALIGAGYGWYGSRFAFNIGAEYLSLGALKTLVPLVVSLGVTF